MSSSMISVTYKYKTIIPDRVYTCDSMDSELTGTSTEKIFERTIVCSKDMLEAVMKHDLKKDDELIGELEIKQVSMNYPAPHYWG